MASNSGSFNTSAYTGSTTRYLTFNWWINRQDIAGNYTEIGWELLGAGGSSTYYKAGRFNVWIAGTQVYYSGDRIELRNGTKVASGTYTLWHNNEGNCYFEASAEAGIYYDAVNCRGSGGWDLPQIPRYTSVWQSERGRTINTISVNWSTSDPRDHTQYSLNGGNWTNAGDTVDSTNKNGYYTVSGLNPNTSYRIKTRCKRTDSQLWSETSEMTITTYAEAKITEAPNFTDEENPTIKYSNPFGNNVATLQACISFDGSKDDIAYRDITKTETSYTFDLTDDERTLLRNKATNTNSLSVIFFIRTTYNGGTYHSTASRTMSIINANPVFSNFTYEDANEHIVEDLTGNNQTIIKGYSNVRGIVSAANKATALKNATMSKYRLSIGDKTNEGSYSSTDDVGIIINNVLSNSFTMYAIDSRGNSTPKTITANTYIDYSPIKITSISLTRTNNVGSETTLKFSGFIWNNNFGIKENNIKECYYRFKETTATDWMVLTKADMDITPTKTGNAFSFTGKIKGDLGTDGFDMDNSYNFEVFIADELSNNFSSPASFILGPGTPAIAIYKNNVAIGGKYDLTKGGKLQIYGDIVGDAFKNLFLQIYPVGAIYISVVYVNPGQLFGGVWEQIKGYYLYASTSSSGNAGHTSSFTGPNSGSGGSGNTGSTSLTVDQMPHHTHGQDAHSHQINGGEDTVASGGYNNNGNQWGASFIYGGQPGSWGFSKLSTFYTKSSQPGIWGTGGGGGHSHSMGSHTHEVPYVATYVWKRIS